MISTTWRLGPSSRFRSNHAELGQLGLERRLDVVNKSFAVDTVNPEPLAKTVVHEDLFEVEKALRLQYIRETTDSALEHIQLAVSEQNSEVALIAAQRSEI